LYFDRALHGIQSAFEVDKECISDRLDFRAIVLWKNGTQQPVMFLKDLERKRFVLLRQSAVAHHIREHDGGQVAMGFGCVGHGCLQLLIDRVGQNRCLRRLKKGTHTLFLQCGMK